nr:MAG TPA: hypothetical protein [Caudoviricetes sp.]
MILKEEYYRLQSNVLSQRGKKLDRLCQFSFLLRFVLLL